LVSEEHLTPIDSATTGSGARRGIDAPKDTLSIVAGSIAVMARPVPRLSRMRTHSEAQKFISVENRHAQQIKLFDMHKIRSETIIVDICNLYPSMHEGQGLLGPYQVRPVQKYFLKQLRKRMESTGVSKEIVSFVPLVDPN
jgi:hypothetical protein